jgi:hypothetical protein
MPENHSRAIEPPRAADGREHAGTKSKFVACEQRLLEEGRELQDGWSFIERLCAFPFERSGPVGMQACSPSCFSRLTF